MKAGLLKKRISIQTFTDAQSPTGEVTQDWVELASRRARIEPLSGKEFWSGQAIESEINIKFIIRFDNSLANLNTKMRVLYNGGLYDIESVINPGERNKELHLMCKTN